MINEEDAARTRVLLMALIHQHGDRVLLTSDTLEDFTDRVRRIAEENPQAMEPTFGWVSLPQGVLLVNLYTDEEIDAWMKGMEDAPSGQTE